LSAEKGDEKLEHVFHLLLNLNFLSNRKTVPLSVKIKTQKTIKSLSSHPEKGIKKGKRFVFFLSIKNLLSEKKFSSSQAEKRNEKRKRLVTFFCQNKRSNKK
jgi:hypothetical protein